MKGRPLTADLREAGDIIAERYRLEGTLGKGGMATVFRATNLSSGRTVALKLASVAHKAGRLRFQREYHTLATLKHPNIVEVYDYGLDGEHPFYTMELIEGESLDKISDLAPQVVCAVLRDVASALALLHGRRLVHRDVTPANIRLTITGEAKLVDFGILATMGVLGEPIGTPPCMAPESLRGMPLDHRVDLFGLGAVGFYLLAGRHAYSRRHARSGLDDLESLWAQPIPSVRDLAQVEVPEALEALIGSLLCPDRLARPRSAAEVIDALSAAGKLPPAPTRIVAQSYLNTTTLVGRRREMKKMGKAVDGALRGRGRCFVIEGASGMGKSRLLGEVCLVGRLKGMLVVEADGGSTNRGPFRVFRAVANELLAAMPKRAAAHAERHASLLCRVLPALLTKRTHQTFPPVQAIVDPSEERRRLQAALSRWLLALTTERPLLILIDDFQRCDEASAALIAHLARQLADRRQLLIVVALRTDETMHAPAAVAALRDAATSLRLHGLELHEVEELLRELFGDARNADRLAVHMHEAGVTSPLHCFEFAHFLVDKGIIAYRDGQWTLPRALQPDQLPTSLIQAMDARVSTLTPGARRLAETLSLDRGDLTLQRIAELDRSAGQTERGAEVLSALDELQAKEVLLGTQERYWFRHDGMREALQRGLSESRRRDIHRQIGAALMARGSLDPDEEEAVGWHLLNGGDASSGAELLERAGRRLFETQSVIEAIAPLEAALEVYEEQQRPPALRLELRSRLVQCCMDQNPSAALRHAEQLLPPLYTYSGLRLANRLGRWLGRALALVVGLIWAFALRLVTPARKRGPSPIEAATTLGGALANIGTIYWSSMDFTQLDSSVEMLEPLSVFKKSLPGAAYLGMRMQRSYALNLWADTENEARTILAIIDDDLRSKPEQYHHKLARMGAQCYLTWVAYARDGKLPEELMQRLQSSDMGAARLIATSLRLLMMRFHGFEGRALEIETDFEDQCIQMGASSLAEAHFWAYSAIGYTVVRDALGLKRCVENMARLEKQGHQHGPSINLARGVYYRERGELEEAKGCLQQVLHVLPPQERFLRTHALIALAETHLGAAELEEADALARQALSLATDPTRGTRLGATCASHVLGLVEAAMGNLDDASRRLEEAIELAVDSLGPAHISYLHEARARVALKADDFSSFEHHARRAVKLFRSTKNPVLAARAIQLEQCAHAGAARAREALQLIRAVTGTVVSLSAEGVCRRLDNARGQRERAIEALQLLLDASSTSSGYLFLKQADGVHLVASTDSTEPPETLVERAKVALGARGLHSSSSAAPDNGAITTMDFDRSLLSWLPISLVLAKTHVVVGLAFVRAGAIVERFPEKDLVHRLATELVKRGDVVTN